jgi:hypothetical protein
MAEPPRTSYVAECFWPDVREADLRDLDRRIEASVDALAGDVEPVRYLGRLLVIDDEVVLVMLDGPIAAVRRVVQHADIPFGRILRAAHVPAPRHPPAEEAPQ